MSVSSPKEEVEAGGPSPENSDHMDRGDAEAQAPELYEFDVKEQDRWLPIANASEKCQMEKRKTVNGEDILFAMTSLGFENYAEALKIYLSKYRETQSARGENQNRPGSSYGPPGGAQAGTGSGNTSSGPNPPSSAAYHPQTEGVNSILSPHGLESSEQDSSPYGNFHPSAAGNNTVGNEPY
ncbi:hypothetical protein MMC31_002069 [Peltigera leucophlebia]|nr:hypothetical protein [Peltigera leucophlebia]